MITHEIKHPEPPTLFQQVASRFRGHPQQHQHRHSASIETYWGKLEYTKWLEEKIRPEWPRGTLCTIKAYPPGEEIPVPLFEVVELQEVHWMAPIAEVVKEPRAILLIGKFSAHVAYPPGLLRKLTEKELELVRIRDQSPEVPKKPDTVGVTPDGEFVRTSGENGEIVERYSG